MKSLPAIALLAACSALAADPKGPAGYTNESQLAGSLGITAPQIGAADLAAAYRENEVRANRDWTDRTAVLTGTVWRIGDLKPGSVIALRGGVNVLSTNTAHLKTIADLSAGDSIEIRGHSMGPRGETGMIVFLADTITRRD